MNRRRFLISCLALALSALTVAAADQTPPLYALCGAYEPELVALKKEFGVDEAHGWRRLRVKGVEFWRGQFAGREVVIFRTGVSLVNAAYQLQLGLDAFPITHVFFAGVAGGTDPALAIGDVVIPEKWAYHGESAYLNEDGHGGYFRPDFLRVSGRENYGMMFPLGVEVVRDGGAQPERLEFIPVDPALLAAAKTALPKLAPMKKAGRVVTVSVGGAGVSGSVFLDNAPYREWVFRAWQARCVDMESAALAHVAYANNKPVLIVRGLSDLAGGQHGKNQIGENEMSVAQIAAHVLRAVVEGL